jgi:Family of unknown function (DUF5947)
MSPDPAGTGNGGEALDRRLDARRRADLVSGLRRLSRAPAAGNGATGPARPGEERCDLCGNEIPADHRHLLHLTERQIICACEPCVALRSGDPELRPTGTRVLWLDDFELSDELWASFQIPIGLAFFMDSTTSGGVVAFYPSPAGSMESELDLDAWERLRAANPVLESLDADGEALLVNRMADPPQHAIAPIDECYRLVGLVKVGWEGISGGSGPEEAIACFFDELHSRGTPA